MKASVAFAFFLLFLAGYALVTVRNMGKEAANSIPTVAELSASAWRPSHIGEMSLAADTDLYVQFEPDGKLGGYAGCNRFFGSYELIEGKLVFGPVAATRMACPEPANSLEISFLEALSATSTAARAESRLALKDEQGLTVLKFVAIERDEN